MCVCMCVHMCACFIQNCEYLFTSTLKSQESLEHGVCVRVFFHVRWEQKPGLLWQEGEQSPCSNSKGAPGFWPPSRAGAVSCGRHATASGALNPKHI